VNVGEGDRVGRRALEPSTCAIERHSRQSLADRRNTIILTSIEHLGECEHRIVRRV
jgi:hypothetical protein